MADSSLSPQPGDSTPALTASEGFHDIKPLPHFLVQTSSSLSILLTLASLIAVAVLLRLKKRRKRFSVTPQLPPIEQLRLTLDELELKLNASGVGKKYAQNLASELSLAVRAYLDRELSDGAPLGTVEMTVEQIKRLLPSVLKQKLAEYPVGKLSDIHEKIVSALKTCERLAFAPQEIISDSESPSQKVLATANGIRELAVELSAIIRNEALRRESVVKREKR